MSGFYNIITPYHPIDGIHDNHHIIIINNKPKKNLFKWIILILVIGILCISILILITTKVIIIFKGNKSINFTNLNYQSLLLNNTKIVSNISKPLKNNISFDCQLPINPNYTEYSTIVAGVFPPSDDQLNNLQGPTSVYLDHERNIYVADTTNHRVRKYSPENSDEGETLIDETSNINSPRCLYIDQESNHLYFLDQDNQGYYRVQFIQLNSYPLKSTILIIGNQTRSYGMSLDKYFNIYVSEYNHHRIIKWLSPKYDQYSIIGENQLIYPRSIYFDKIKNNLYVADKNQIQRWSNNSNQSQIVMQGGSLCPNGIECDCHGNLYISQDKTIKLINNKTGLTGIDIIGYQYYGSTDPRFKSVDYLYYPEGIYLDKTNGDFYVADSGLNRIKKYTLRN